MPRQARIDAPGALHHIIARGIRRRKIFNDREYRHRFIERLSQLIGETQTGCYAWALLPNHFHLLLRTGAKPIATLMRRLLTGHAIYYNQRHRRSGHLFQNRYKSILCQEEPYLLELVRYIHLNPLRAKLVSDMGQLDRYASSGHSTLMGKRTNEWQDPAYILQRFGKRLKPARQKYRDFVQQGIQLGKRPDLIGGGLIRSAGGWSAVKQLRRANAYQKGDERILGDGQYVQDVLNQAAESLDRQYRLKAQGMDIEQVTRRVAQIMDMSIKEVWSPGKYRRIVKARSLLCYWAVRELGISMASLSRRLHISSAAVSQSVQRGEILAKENHYHLIHKT